MNYRCVLFEKKGKRNGGPSGVRFRILNISQIVLFQKARDCRNQSALAAGNTEGV